MGGVALCGASAGGGPRALAARETTGRWGVTMQMRRVVRSESFRGPCGGTRDADESSAAQTNSVPPAARARQGSRSDPAELERSRQRMGALWEGTRPLREKGTRGSRREVGTKRKPRRPKGSRSPERIALLGGGGCTGGSAEGGGGGRGVEAGSTSGLAPSRRRGRRFERCGSLCDGSAWR